MISVGQLAGWPGNCLAGQKLKHCKARSFELCVIITLLGVYIVILGFMTMSLFQGHRCVKNINCQLRVLDSCPL